MADIKQKIIIESELEGKGFRDAARGADKLADEFDALRASTEQLAKEETLLGEISKQTLTSSFDAMRLEAKDVDEQFARLRQKTADLADVLGGPSASSIAETAEGLNTLERQLRETGQLTDEWTASLDKQRASLRDAERQLVRNEVAIEKLEAATKSQIQATIAQDRAFIRSTAQMRLAEQQQDALIQQQLLLLTATQKLNGPGGMQVLASNMGLVGKVAGGSFAIGLGIAKKAGTDFEVTLEAMDKVITGLSKHIQGLVTLDLAAWFDQMTFGLAQNTALRKELEKQPALLDRIVNGVQDLFREEAELSTGQVMAAKMFAQSAKRKRERAEAEREATEATQENTKATQDNADAIRRAMGEILADRIAAQTAAQEFLAELGEFDTEAALRDSIDRTNEAVANHMERLRESVLAARNDIALAGTELTQAHIDQFREASEAEIRLAQVSTEERRALAIRLAEELIALQDQVAANSEMTERRKAQAAFRAASGRVSAEFGQASATIDLAGQVFGQSKEFSIAAAIANTAQGITRALATEGWLGIVQAALIAAMGLKQVQEIRAQEPAPPGIAPPNIGGTPNFDNPANDAAAMFAGARAGSKSAQDLVNLFESNFTSGFQRQMIKTGTDRAAASQTQKPGSTSIDASMTIQGNVIGDRRFVRKLNKQQRAYGGRVQRKTLTPRKRTRR